MVAVTYYCPHCGAVTSLERDGYLADKSVTAEPLDGWEYAATTEDFADADGVEMVCLGDASPGVAKRADEATDGDGPQDGDGCGRTFYLNFVRFEDGSEVEAGDGWLEDEPNFDFLR